MVSLSFVEGVIKVDPSGLNGRKGISISISAHDKNCKKCAPNLNISFFFAVFVYLACAFRYGSDDLDVMGLSFRRDIWIQRIQVYPPADETTAKTPMLEFLLNKVGEQGYPFSFQVRGNNSLTLYIRHKITPVLKSKFILIHFRSISHH